MRSWRQQGRFGRPVSFPLVQQDIVVRAVVVIFLIGHGLKKERSFSLRKREAKNG